MRIRLRPPLPLILPWQPAHRPEHARIALWNTMSTWIGTKALISIQALPSPRPAAFAAQDAFPRFYQLR